MHKNRICTCYLRPAQCAWHRNCFRQMHTYIYIYTIHVRTYTYIHIYMYKYSPLSHRSPHSPHSPDTSEMVPKQQAVRAWKKNANRCGPRTRIGSRSVKWKAKKENKKGRNGARGSIWCMCVLSFYLCGCERLRGCVCTHFLYI
jgi:hypothetical protein